MRISDWSSDVCSSDLLAVEAEELAVRCVQRQTVNLRPVNAAPSEYEIHVSSCERTCARTCLALSSTAMGGSLTPTASARLWPMFVLTHLSHSIRVSARSLNRPGLLAYPG